MNATGLMAQLMRELRPQMNGAVTGAMEDWGIVYPLNYGVSIPTIRSIAGKYAPNHKLAELLYKQQIRELVLSATMIADASQITIDNACKWADGVLNVEVAEHLAQLIVRSPYALAIASMWLKDGRRDIVYAGLLILAKVVEPNVAVEILDSIDLLLEREDKIIFRGVELVWVAIGRMDDDLRSLIVGRCNALDESSESLQRDLSEEVRWQIEC